MTDEKKENKLVNKSFLWGAMLGVLVLCSVGFVILLVVFLSGGLSSAKQEQPVVVTQPSNQVAEPANAPASDIVLAKITKDDHIKGDFNAPVTIVEFSDTECPFCKRFHDTMNQIMKKFPNDVRWVYKHAPLDGLHRKARKEAEAFECAAELGGNDGFWEYADRLFEITPSNDGLDPEKLYEIAATVGLNKSKFTKCLDSGKYADKVQAQLSEASIAGMQGTPYSVVVFEDQKFPLGGALPFEQLEQSISQLLSN
jgi:protein-disulfide isomerase